MASADHSSALSCWRDIARQAKRGEDPQAFPLKEWLLYQMRFVIPSEMVGPSTAFGSLASQVGHFPIVLNMDTVDSVDVALPYDRLLKQNLGRKHARGAKRRSAFFSPSESPVNFDHLFYVF